MKPLIRLTIALLTATVMSFGTAINPAAADERQDLLTLKATVLNLVDALVAQGVLDRDAADALVRKAEQEAQATASAESGGQTVAVQDPLAHSMGVPNSGGANSVGVPGSSPPNSVGVPGSGVGVSGSVVRVPYVPEMVKQEIREQVRSELRRDVLADVEAKAKAERWGTPDALPDWVSNFKLSGDFRVRHQLDQYGNENPGTLSPDNLYLDILEVNEAGGIGAAGPNAFFNTSQDVNRWRLRGRFEVAATIADRWLFDARVATGDGRNPDSTNVTLGDYGRGFDINLDRAFAQYNAPASVGAPWLTATVGRLPNPFYSTDLVWDEDLNFDGVAATFRYRLGDKGLNAMPDRRRSLNLTAALFPIDQVEFDSADKWLAAGQLHGIWEFDNQNSVQMGVAFYDYIHTIGRRNPLGSTLTNSTAPDFLQKGNLLYNIANDPNLDGGLNDQLFGLASDYRLLNITSSVDLAHLAPYHVILTADIVKNYGFDESEITQRTGGVTYLYPIKDRTLGWRMEMLVGWPVISKFGDWQVTGAYRYLQRDAVLDAFTDSDFHLGGTDSRGYIVGASYGLARNLWFRAQYLSANEIDGPPLAIDVLQFDLNARF